MTRSELVSLVREVMAELDEANVTGGTATFTPGTGYKNVKRKKRPYSTKLIDYLQNENNNSN